MSPDGSLVERLAGLEPAQTDEAAAVAVAIGAHLRDQELGAAAEASDDGGSWTGRRWSYADRLDRDGGRGVRVAEGTPTDPWTAAGRADRL